MRVRVNDVYFSWLSDIVYPYRYSEQFSYDKLLRCLHDIEFRCVIPRDRNRAEDGMDLRYRFADEYVTVSHAETYLDEPCSVLEMMVALAIRCEETIMDDPSIGDRTSKWFWDMIKNLGLHTMTNHRFDRLCVEAVIDRFLDREYEPDGTGGLFTIRNCNVDLRTVEIWHQLCWYLDSIS